MSIPEKRCRFVSNREMRPLYEQESTLIKGIFGMCLCFASEGIEIIRDQMKRYGQVMNTIDSRLQQIVTKVVSLVEEYSIVLEYLSKDHKGPTQQALCEGILEFRDEFVTKVCDLEKEARINFWTLQEVVVELMKSLQTLKPICSVITHISGDEIPAAVFNVLAEQKILFGGNLTSERVIEKLLEKTSQPLFAFVSGWMSNGDFLYDEFFIRPVNNAPIYVEQEVPFFLAPHAMVIFQTGQYLRSIAQYRKQHETELFQQMLLQQAPEIEDEIPKTPILKLESNVIFSPLKMKAMIREQSDAVNKALFIVFQQCHIDSTYHILRETYLFGNPTIYFNFFDVSHGILSRKYFHEDEMPTSYRVLDSLLFELKGIKIPPSSISISFVKDCVAKFVDENVQDGVRYMFEVVTIENVIPFPLSLIVDDNATKRYQVIFRFLFDLEYHRYLLARTMKKMTNTSLPLVREVRYASLRFHLHLLVSECMKALEEIMIQCECNVIEKKWDTFIKKEKKTVKELSDMHSEFLDGCLQEIGLKDRVVVSGYFSFLKHVKEVLQTVYTVENASDKGNVTNQEDIKQIDDLREETRELMDSVCSLLPDTSIEKRNACYRRMSTEVAMEDEVRDPFADIVDWNM
ncbi:hypothetical protein EIN_499270 [Entamoeba invadens IP1]|uniref:Spindle pole body component n=1 Tax=Entamoeba invadens IP1 TaxID=370355 RepID=A0A0A1UDL8_ENTIV|nr:hypothetical protein EIN_499270 [Entamoeba invadens IP1]ELP94667.1 hypothetical protein EIN_499270 [Entamoeba invadens IP1]|eukprot:XP_004261438.1 hypothetical protein EIN_499270 [Entamoeba invadens IP1]